MNENGIQNCTEPLSMKMLSVLFLSMRRYRVIDIEARPRIEELRVIEKELRSMLRHMHYSISFEHWHFVKQFELWIIIFVKAFY